MMRRRTFLASAVLAALAGCSSSDDTTEDIETQTDADTDAESDSDSDDEAETTEETTEEASGEAAIEIVDQELVVDEGEYTTDVYVAATVENTGDAPSGVVNLTADWYDSEGSYLDNDEEYLQTLGAGETWAARVYHLGSSEDVDDFELSGEFDTEPPAELDGVSVTDSEMQVGEDEVVIQGTVANETGDTVDYLKGIGTVYDGNGVVLNDRWTNVTDVPAGEEWSFEISWRGRDRVADAADHSITVTDS